MGADNSEVEVSLYVAVSIAAGAVWSQTQRRQVWSQVLMSLSVCVCVCVLGQFVVILLVWL